VADVLVHSAGWFPFTDFESTSYAEWSQVMRTNLDGPFLMTQALSPLLKKSNNGRIINISSGNESVSSLNGTSYATAKAGTIGFTRAFAVSLDQYRITVNAITSDFLNKTSSISFNSSADFNSIKKGQTADDLIGTIVFLASD
jgi:NAD(P)-dependent dehydrogenase (short-subunit alcohol dehydrogenase family)